MKQPISVTNPITAGSQKSQSSRTAFAVRSSHEEFLRPLSVWMRVHRDEAAGADQSGQTVGSAEPFVFNWPADYGSGGFTEATRRGSPARAPAASSERGGGNVSATPVFR